MLGSCPVSSLDKEEFGNGPDVLHTLGDFSLADAAAPAARLPFDTKSCSGVFRGKHARPSGSGEPGTSSAPRQRRHICVFALMTAAPPTERSGIETRQHMRSFGCIALASGAADVLHESFLARSVMLAVCFVLQKYYRVSMNLVRSSSEVLRCRKATGVTCRAWAPPNMLGAECLLRFANSSQRARRSYHYFDAT